MAISNIAMRAYDQAIQTGGGINRQSLQEKKRFSGLNVNQSQTPSFGETLTESLDKVNAMQAEKGRMIEAFASGEEQNVHELMISLQKAGIAMSMTSAVRNKAMESFKTIMTMPF